MKYSGFSDDETESEHELFFSEGSGDSPSVLRNEVVLWHSDGMFEPLSIHDSEVEGFNATITDPRAFYSFGLYAIKDHRNLEEYLLSSESKD